MRIGELAQRSGVSARSLRYYEQQGLLRPERHANGYRSYGPDAVETVRSIQTLLAAGLTTESAAEVLPCTDAGPTLRPCTGVRTRLTEELTSLEAQLDALAASRELLATLVTDGQAPPGAPTTRTAPQHRPRGRGTHRNTEP